MFISVVVEAIFLKAVAEAWPSLANAWPSLANAKASWADMVYKGIDLPLATSV